MNEQLNIFSVFRRDFRINNKIRLIELFAGVGSQAMALKRLGATLNITRLLNLISTQSKVTTQFTEQILNLQT